MPEAKIKRVRLSDLQIDYAYQRPLSPTRADSIAARWSDRKAGIIVVSDRGPTGLFTIDGQHRVRSAEIKGRTTLRAEIYTDLTRKDEAEMFDALNDDRARVDPLTRFRAQVLYGNETAIAIKRAVEGAGAEIQPHATESRFRGIRAVNTLRRIYTRSGRGALAWVIGVIIEAYGQADYTTAPSSLLGGLEIVYANDANQPNGPFDYDRLIRRLKEEGPLALRRLAATNAQIFGGYGAKNVYRAIAEIYNRGLSAKSGNQIGGEVRIRKINPGPPGA